MDSRALTRAPLSESYMAPEVHTASKSHGRGYSYGVDWFALGVMMWEVMSGGTALPPSVNRVLAALRENKNLEDSDFTDLLPSHFSCSYMQHLSADAQDFMTRLLAKSQEERLGDRTIKSHPFFKDVNWAAVDARIVPAPWGAESLMELAGKRVDESVEERKTAEKAVSAIAGTRMDFVSNFDFVSPRAIMEEYMENIYMLRGNYDEHHDDLHDVDQTERSVSPRPRA